MTLAQEQKKKSDPASRPSRLRGASGRRIVAEPWRPKAGERVRLIGRDADGNELEVEAVVLRVHDGQAMVRFRDGRRERTGEADGPAASIECEGREG